MTLASTTGRSMLMPGIRIRTGGWGGSTGDNKPGSMRMGPATAGREGAGEGAGDIPGVVTEITGAESTRRYSWGKKARRTPVTIRLILTAFRGKRCNIWRKLSIALQPDKKRIRKILRVQR
ncbi:MAG: hypothetical protein UX91_C0006G0031 [Candidatus Amesbacteria bacterium GW2011_GWB1_47_19]|nr:MAG: hypothetical protein UW51_C0002G0031 [Candidatus Amesbacteria bacterium GW2011_GWA1_44_24]KKU31379.1 MAG: hypothetical protein UX46_C0006G0171 [Candidatus Amesbacteria bacterium GW2011_GWC1_46_24]KKU66969.1 MAG: hypothetical protein UX91_C0006G0031 [Candidatus Amesbacteria bacterium GW2011_GWB1_47_19]